MDYQILINKRTPDWDMKNIRAAIDRVRQELKTTVSEKGKQWI